MQAFYVEPHVLVLCGDIDVWCGMTEVNAKFILYLDLQGKSFHLLSIDEIIKLNHHFLTL